MFGTYALKNTNQVEVNLLYRLTCNTSYKWCVEWWGWCNDKVNVKNKNIGENYENSKS